jgi:hypothetical protein
LVPPVINILFLVQPSSQNEEKDSEEKEQDFPHYKYVIIGGNFVEHTDC